NNIIFSKGLVNAYYLESKKANYPRVVVDTKIINKILEYRLSQIEFFGIDKWIVSDWEATYFLDPFDLGNSAIRQLEAISNRITIDESDPMIASVTSFTKYSLNSTLNLIKETVHQSQDELGKIRSKTVDIFLRHRSNEVISLKYAWLLEFIA